MKKKKKKIQKILTVKASVKIVIIFLEDFFFYFTALQFLLNSMSWQKKKNKFPSLTGISLRPNFKR